MAWRRSWEEQSMSCLESTGERREDLISGTPLGYGRVARQSGIKEGGGFAMHQPDHIWSHECVCGAQHDVKRCLAEDWVVVALGEQENLSHHFLLTLSNTDTDRVSLK